MTHDPIDHELAGRIQHTLIAAGTTRQEILDHCAQCVEYGFNAAMVPGSWVETAAAELAGTGVVVASALDFPTVGVMTSAGKAAEAAELVRRGARQIDIGVQVGWLRSGMYEEFRDDIAGVVKATMVPIKVMLELPLLTPEQRDTAVDLAVEAGAAYLKNASGGGVETANAASIGYLAERAPGNVQVKASGAITTREQAHALLTAGASLLGTSAGVTIVTSDDSAASY
ncbi:deoxyribose-phosphate aldolase [Spiractinospora alimapuensis]|uniref:deoxyribose-phosphate aldolase n=1 Tax=Spiractinospora alimapuensis TaxID=2820884 RepID=UPI001F45FD46|nr:deoxyribose-phosphate aldolase [Spiractinospora alimapuensis]QVQ51578.1 deoxyribose-phosphate aldolase [Spiractinospora alimapuensis]